MKKLKIILIISTLIFALTLTACNKSTDNPDKNPDVPPTPPSPSIPISDEAMKKIHEIYDNATTTPQTVTTVQQLAILTSLCASRKDSAGPISVTAAKLNDEEITLVTLGGTENKEGQATTMDESRLASFGQENDYLKAVVNLIVNHTIPKDKPVLIAGISLGGMIAQQLIGKLQLFKDNNIEIKGIVCFGAPFTKPAEKFRSEVRVVRFTDEKDIVPNIGEMPIIDYNKKQIKEALDKKEKIIRTSNYSGIEAHALSYISEDCWNDVDFLGCVEKNNKLELTSDMTFYPAPKLS